jgi:hypothetical protein
MPRCPKCRVDAAGNFRPTCGTPVNGVGSPGNAQAPPPVIKLVCPKCSAQNPYQLGGTLDRYGVRCSSCAADFQTRIVQIRAKTSRRFRRRFRHFSVRVINRLGQQDLIEFKSRSADFELRAGDAAAFSYVGSHLSVVQNLTVHRFMKILDGCYVATYVYGPDSREVAILRRFRDEVLLRSALLALGVDIYYSLSPLAVRWFGKLTWFRFGCMKMLEPVVRAVFKCLAERPRRFPGAFRGV